MTNNVRITTTASLTASTITARDLKDFLRDIPDTATISTTEDRDRGLSSTTYRASWTPAAKATR